ncbi:MAG: DUF2948 family protein [Alphaproteobacteria bacterium]|nr:DUF2948 family protein [Alphaproteobacteria bacterium]
MTRAVNDEPLLLRAVDPEGLLLAAACVQDSLATIADMAYVPGERRFALLLDRFRWERRPRGRIGRRIDRVRAAVRFEHVLQVRRRGLVETAGPAVLELLTLTFTPTAGETSGIIDLVFAGGAAIRLDVAALSCQIEDLGTPVPSRLRPRHRLH